MYKKKDDKGGPKKIIPRKRFSLKHALEPRILFDATLGAAQQVVEHLVAQTDIADKAQGQDTHSKDTQSKDTSNANTKEIQTQIPQATATANVHKEAPQQVNTPVKAVLSPDRDTSDHEQSSLETKASNSSHQKDFTDFAKEIGEAGSKTQLLFVDSGIHGYQQLVYSANSNVEIILLDPNRDGFSQITDTLANRHNVSGISLITNSDAGKMSLGNSILSEGSLNTHASEISSWYANLAKDATLSIYGSDATKSMADQNVLAHFSNLIKTPISTSNNLTNSGLIQDGVNLQLDKGTIYSVEQSVNDPHFSDLQQDIQDAIIVPIIKESTDSNQQAFSIGITTTSILQDPVHTLSITEGTSITEKIFTATEHEFNNTYFLTGPDASSFAVDSGGNVRFITPNDYETKSSYNFTLNVYENDAPHSTEAVTVNVVDLPPVIYSANGAYVLDGSPAGSVVYETVAADPAGGGITYTLAGLDAGAFSIHATTGVVTLNSAANLQEKSSYSFIVKAHDPTGAYSAQTVTIVVTDTLNPNPPAIIPTVTYDIIELDPTIPSNEGTSLSTVVYTAADQPAGKSYQLIETDASSFTINGNGEIKFVAIPNYEAKTDYHIVIYTFSNNIPHSTEIVDVVITNLPPVISSTSTPSINENVVAGSTVYTAVAEDIAGGTVTYSFDPVAGTDYNDFNINAATGAVSFKTIVPNFETKSSYSFVIKASDPNGLFNTQTITLSINDLGPTFTSANTVSVDERIPAGNSNPFYFANATGTGTITYTKSGTDHNDFNLNSSTGALSFKNPPNFENKSTYSFNIIATDSAAPVEPKTQAMTININDLGPTITSPTSVTVDENFSTEDVVYTIQATSNMPGTITYSKSGGGQSGAGAFDINPNTGELKFKSSPDFENRSSYTFNVTATVTSGGVSESKTQEITIFINDLGPVFDSANSVTVDEGYPSGQENPFYTASATGTGTITYTKEGGQANSFNLNPSTGELSFKNEPNFENRSTYTFDLIATDSATGESRTQEMTINVTNLAPVFDSGNSTTVTLNENVSTNTTVYNAGADSDDPGGGNVTYSLQGTDASYFTINSNSGVVKFINPPNFENKSSYNFEVKASDPSGAFSIKEVTVNINDLGPNFTTGISVTVDEGIDAGATIYTANATGSGTVTYTKSGDDQNYFNLNSSTGALSFITPPNFEDKSSYTINIIATDSTGESRVQAITINIADLPPSIIIPAPNNTTTSAQSDSDTSADITNTSIAAAKKTNINTQAIIEASKVSQAHDTQTAANDSLTTGTDNTAILDSTAIDKVTYGITEGVHATNVINGVLYNVSAKGTYGDLYINTSTGEYIYQRNDVALHPRITNVTERFVVTIHDGKGTINLNFTVTASNLNSKPSLDATVTSENTSNYKSPADISILKSMTGQVVVGAVIYRPDKPDVIEVQNGSKSVAQIHNERFNANINSLLKDFGFL